MTPVVVHIASGHAFFSGLGLLILAAVLAGSARQRIRRFAPLVVFTGAAAIALSSTAIPYWAYALLVICVVNWATCRRTGQRQNRAAIGMIAACVLCASMELPYHATPILTPVQSRALAIVGDSVTAGGGIEGREVTWPNLFGRDHDIHIDDFSHVGETAASALKRIRSHTIAAPVVLVEIGGNDILGSTTAPQFEQDLNALLAHLSAPGRQVVMFELPLPPLYHEFGRAQRATARRHHVFLIPKRVFLGLLAGSDATLDSIHLSQAGHARMADLVWQIFGRAYADAAPADRQPVRNQAAETPQHDRRSAP